MAEYAEIAKTNPRPWEEFEWYDRECIGDWVTHTTHPCWTIGHKYRRKPKPPQKKKVRVYQWICETVDRSDFFVTTWLSTADKMPFNGIQRIEPGFEIEIEEES